MATIEQSYCAIFFKNNSYIETYLAIRYTNFLFLFYFYYLSLCFIPNFNISIFFNIEFLSKHLSPVEYFFSFILYDTFSLFFNFLSLSFYFFSILSIFLEFSVLKVFFFSMQILDSNSYYHHVKFYMELTLLLSFLLLFVTVKYISLIKE